jgi:hypothetical protein
MVTGLGDTYDEELKKRFKALVLCNVDIIGWERDCGLRAHEVFLRVYDCDIEDATTPEEA